MTIRAATLLATVCTLLYAVGCQVKPTTSTSAKDAGRAGAGQSGGASADIDPRAAAVLKASSDTLTAAKTLSFRVEVAMDVKLPSGQMAQITRKSEISFQRPDRIFIQSAGSQGTHRIWYSGRSLTVLDSAKNVYASLQTPGKVDDMLDELAEKYGVTMPAADLLVSDPYDSAMSRVQSGRYLGLHTIDGHECHHLAFTSPGAAWQIWIDANASVPRKLVIAHPDQAGQPECVALIDHWNLSPKFPAGTFVFQPPQGAKSVPVEDLLASRGE